MDSQRSFPIAVIVAAVLLVAGTIPSFAEVTFYLQREGSPGDTGLALFQAAAPGYVVQDFEDPALGGDGTYVTSIPVGPYQFALETILLNGTPYVPSVGYSIEFDHPDQMYLLALATTTNLTLTPSGGERGLMAFGTWIFDDGKAMDSAYLMTVTESNGRVWQAVLVNDAPLDIYRHELEGFIGAVSNVGIVAVRIDAVSPTTGLAQSDSFELDHMVAAEFPPPPPTGACCKPDYTCVVDTQAACSGVGKWLGLNSSCEQCPPPPPPPPPPVDVGGSSGAGNAYGHDHAKRHNPGHVGCCHGRFDDPVPKPGVKNGPPVTPPGKPAK